MFRKVSKPHASAILDVTAVTVLPWGMATKTYLKQVVHHCPVCGQHMEVEVHEFRTFGGDIHKTKSEPTCTNPKCSSQNN